MRLFTENAIAEASLSNKKKNNTHRTSIVTYMLQSVRFHTHAGARKQTQ